MRAIIWVLLFFSTNAFSQLPDIFDIEFNCSGPEDEMYFDGRYIKSDIVESVLGMRDGWPAPLCGCWDRQGTNDVLLVLSDIGSSFKYTLAHLTSVSGGCKGGGTVSGVYRSALNPFNDCELSNFTGLSLQLPMGGCSDFNLTAVNNIPTLSQWSSIILCLGILILGLVGVRQYSNHSDQTT